MGNAHTEVENYSQPKVSNLQNGVIKGEKVETLAAPNVYESEIKLSPPYQQ